MDRHKLILALPAGAQARLFATLWRTGRIWRVPQYAVLKRFFVMCGADERAMRDIAKRARSPEQWADLWRAEAERTRARAQRELEAGHLVTARESLRIAAMAYAMVLWQTNNFDRRLQVYPDMLETFDQFGQLAEPKVEGIDIPLEPAPLAAHLRLPHGAAPEVRLPVVVLVQGLDTIKESVDVVEQSLLDRGLAVLTVEQPGSGESRIRGVVLTGRDSLEAAAHAVVDAIGHRRELDAERIGVLGVSFGGFVAPFFAAVEPRFHALGVFGAMWRFPSPEGMARNPFYGSVTRVMTGIEDEQQLVGVLGELDLAPVANRIAVPTAILQGEADTLFVEGARRLHDAVAGPKALRMVPDGDHGLTWHQDELPFLWDWMADHLGAAAPLTAPTSPLADHVNA